MTGKKTMINAEFLTQVFYGIKPFMRIFLPMIGIAICIKLFIFFNTKASKGEKGKERENDFEKRKNKVKGAAYEKKIGKQLETEGWEIEYRGENLGKKDGGIDLIGKQRGLTLLIQCKYNSDARFTHHENVIHQFAGAFNTYRHDHPNEKVIARFETTGAISQEARRAAKIHGIEI